MDWMFVSPQLYMLNPNPQCDSTCCRYWEVEPLGCDSVMRVEPSWMELVLFWGRHQSSLAFFTRWGYREDTARKLTLTGHWIRWCLDLVFPSLQNCEKLTLRRHNIISISIIPQKIYRFNVMSTKILASFLGRNWQMDAKIYVDM